MSLETELKAKLYDLEQDAKTTAMQLKIFNEAIAESVKELGKDIKEDLSKDKFISYIKELVEAAKVVSISSDEVSLVVNGEDKTLTITVPELYTPELKITNEPDPTVATVKLNDDVLEISPVGDGQSSVDVSATFEDGLTRTLTVFIDVYPKGKQIQ